MSKIVYIANSTIPSRTANSIHVMKMCEALAGAGNEVELVYPIHGSDSEAGASDIFGHYGVCPSFSLHLLKRPAIRGARYYFAIRAALRAWWRGVRFAFCRNHWAAYFCALIGIPTLFEAHAPLAEDDRTGQRLFRRLIRCSQFRQLIVITQALHDHYVSRFPELDGWVTVLPDAASPVPEGVEPERLVTDTGTFNVGYVGQLYRGKGMELIARLAPLCPDMTFHVVGGLDVDIEYWMRECAGQGNVVFHGYVTHRRVPGSSWAWMWSCYPISRLSQRTEADSATSANGLLRSKRSSTWLLARRLLLRICRPCVKFCAMARTHSCARPIHLINGVQPLCASWLTRVCAHALPEWGTQTSSRNTHGAPARAKPWSLSREVGAGDIVLVGRWCRARSD